MVIFNEEEHTYQVGGKFLPSVSRILMDEGFIDAAFYNEKGRERGTAVHRRVKEHCMGQHCAALSPDQEAYFEGFLYFQRMRDWVPLIVEKPMHHLNLFAGTPDQIGLLDGKPSLLDIKTGDLTPAVPLQEAAYEILSKQRLFRFALQLFPKHPWYKITPYTDRNDRHIFLSAVATWYYKLNHNIGNRKKLWER